MNANKHHYYIIHYIMFRVVIVIFPTCPSQCVAKGSVMAKEDDEEKRERIVIVEDEFTIYLPKLYETSTNKSFQQKESLKNIM